jgi:hypothetical protein
LLCLFLTHQAAPAVALASLVVIPAGDLLFSFFLAGFTVGGVTKEVVILSAAKNPCISLLVLFVLDPARSICGVSASLVVIPAGDLLFSFFQPDAISSQSRGDALGRS